MANFLVTLDPDPERRAAFCRRAAQHIALMPGLAPGTISCGRMTALWAAGPRAPIAVREDARGAVILLGDAIDSGGARMSVDDVRAAWTQSDRVPPAVDGYHAAVVYAPATGLRIGTDLIGMFPVYWWAQGDVLLAGSSPELFRLHPAFRPTLDPEGLAAILLTSLSIGGRTLEHGVRRLAPGFALWAAPGSPPNERRQYTLPLSSRYHDLPFSAQADLLHEALTDSVGRHAPRNEPCAQSLSGGRDSRQLAGMLHAQGTAVTAVTFGDGRDFEMRCAVAVARETAREHRTLALEVDPDGAFVEQHARWLHCASGFNAVSHWGSGARMVNMPARMVTGYAMDPIVGGTHVMWAYDKAHRRFTFDAFFARLNAYAIPGDTLGALLAPIGGRDLVAAAKQAVRDVYESYSDVESQRAWCFDVHHRQRLHVGTSPWLFSFGIWPVQPAIDTRVLEVAGGLPIGTLAERRAQDAIIIKRFPTLAELPLDRNNCDTTPLAPRARYVAVQSVRQRLARLRRVAGDGGRAAERRFYYRLYDVNGRGWRAARRLAEPHRDALDGIVDRAQLDAYLPPPDQDLVMRNGIVDASGSKLLVGLTLWARDHVR
jgi:asparagine synthase (glutamine-hydrolysing)